MNGWVVTLKAMTPGRGEHCETNWARFAATADTMAASHNGGKRRGRDRGGQQNAWGTHQLTFRCLASPARPKK